jgi:hypothetical protein
MTTPPIFQTLESEAEKGKVLFPSPQVHDEPLEDEAKTKGQNDLADQSGISPLCRDQDAKIESHSQPSSKKKERMKLGQNPIFNPKG